MSARSGGLQPALLPCAIPPIIASFPYPKFRLVRSPLGHGQGMCLSSLPIVDVDVVPPILPLAEADIYLRLQAALQ